MLAILNEMSKHFHPDTKTIDLALFNVVYIAPMKGNFSKRLKPYDMEAGDRRFPNDEAANYTSFNHRYDPREVGFDFSL